MTRGLLKSILLHFSVVLIFMYGAEIFKKNKRFEIYEIPLDIVDISDTTVNKIEEKKNTKTTSKKKKDYFSPPKIKSKPKPPEFSLKSKDKVAKIDDVKDEKKIKKRSDKKRMESILKSIEKIKSDNKPDNKNEKEPEDKTDEIEEIKEVRLGEKLTISEKDAIRRQFYRCWIVPAGAKNLKELIVSIKIKLNEDGEVIFSKLLTNNKSKNTFFRAASESAMRAINHPECKKLKVPKKKYETWKEIILDFDPSQSLN